MVTKSMNLAGHYLSSLRHYLLQGTDGDLTPAVTLGRQARRQGLTILDLANSHEVALSSLIEKPISVDQPNAAILIAHAGSFFREALDALATTRVSVGERALLAARKRLAGEIIKRKDAEIALKECRRQQSHLVVSSNLMQEQMRNLSHQILMAQEEERKNISRELHDEISQILTGINVRLAALMIEASTNTGSLKGKIATTQRLVEKSVAVVHRFARELRPAMLDDLGLVPTLVSLVKEFGTRTGLRVRVACDTAEQIDQLDGIKRSVFYRVAQEALTNISKHANATRTTVTVEVLADSVKMIVTDDGKAFDVTRTLGAKNPKRLGVIGMRERVEMVGGTFSIDSDPATGTNVNVRIPIGSAFAG